MYKSLLTFGIVLTSANLCVLAQHLDEIPDNTRIELVLDQTINAVEITGMSDDTLKLKAHLAKDITVKGKTLLPAGTEFTGQILKPKNGLKKPSEIGLEFTDVKLPNGDFQKVPIQLHVVGGFTRVRRGDNIVAFHSDNLRDSAKKQWSGWFIGTKTHDVELKVGDIIPFDYHTEI